MGGVALHLDISDVNDLEGHPPNHRPAYPTSIRLAAVLSEEFGGKLSDDFSEATLPHSGTHNSFLSFQNLS